MINYTPFHCKVTQSRRNWCLSY